MGRKSITNSHVLPFKGKPYCPHLSKSDIENCAWKVYIGVGSSTDRSRTNDRSPRVRRFACTGSFDAIAKPQYPIRGPETRPVSLESLDPRSCHGVCETMGNLAHRELRHDASSVLSLRDSLTAGAEIVERLCAGQRYLAVGCFACPVEKPSCRSGKLDHVD